MTTLRNSQLLQQVKAHPLKSSLARALDVAENFQGDCQFQAKLKAAIADLRDCRAPIAELEKRLDGKRKAVAMPPFKQDDIVGFLRRQELRATLRSMDAGARAGDRE
jgi:hypothetical protein